MEKNKDDQIIDFISGARVKASPEEIEAVQPFAKRLVEDFGYPKEHIITHPQCRIRRSPSDESKSYPIDIAVFSDVARRDDDLFMVVECKQKEREDGIEQLKIYLDFCAATIGVWFNGDELSFIQKFVSKKGVNAYREIPAIPLFGQRIEDIGKFYRKDLKPTLNLRMVFKIIRNYIAGNTTGVTRDETIASEIINILFCKIYDEINTAPDEILKFRYGINEDPQVVSDRVQKIFEQNVKKDYGDVFSKHDVITLDPKTLSYVVSELQPYCITEAERDIIGEAFEIFIGPALKGSQGQFFTPRNIVRTAVEIIDPAIDARILDPACGSGGFLIVALEHVWDKINHEAVHRGMGKHWVRKREDEIAQRNIRGIDKDFFLSKITKAYMAIIGDGRGGIYCENSLLKNTEWRSAAKTELMDKEFDVVITNPPFGAKITISDVSILRNYELGYKWKKDKTGEWVKTPKLLKKQAPQILFIERCLQFLKPGGTLGIVLPDGILGGAKIGYVPHFITTHFEVIASIDCPIESFSPNTTTKVHLLILKKRAKQASIPRVFMSVPEIIGHDKKGHAVYLDERNQILRDDLKLTVTRWKEFVGGTLKSTPFGFSVHARELEESLNAKRYLPSFMEILRRVKASKWQKATIGDIYQKLSTGANVDNLDYTIDPQEGIPYILVKNVLDEGVSFSNLKYVKKEIADKCLGAIVKEGDIIINRCGDAGIAAIVSKDLAGALLCGFCFLFRVKRKFDPNYVAAFLNSELGRKQLKRLSLGSILEHITKEELKGVVVLFPPDSLIEKEISKAFKQATDYRVKAREQLLNVDKTFLTNAV